MTPADYLKNGLCKCTILTTNAIYESEVMGKR